MPAAPIPTGSDRPRSTGTPNAQAAGPLPTRPDRPRPAALRVLRALAASPRPMTVNDLQAVLGGHVNAIRLQLDELVDRAFATTAALPASGRGRPARAYAPTVAGRQVAGQDAPGDPALIGAVAEYLATTPNPREAALALGRAWGVRLRREDEPEPAAGGGPSPDVVALLARQGFTPVVDARGLRILTCPMLDAARLRPDVVCALHQGLLDAVSDDGLRLVPFGAEDACLVVADPE